MNVFCSSCAMAPRVVARLLLATLLIVATEGRLLAAGPTPTFAVLAPLFMDDDEQIDTFKSQLIDASKKGVQAVSVDVWWGKVQPTSQNNFDWGYYEKVFSMIKHADLKIVPIISLHRCGPNLECGGSGAINVPAWVFDLATDMKYLSEKGVTHEDAVSVWATQDAKVLAAFKGFISAFADEFHQKALEGEFLEINVSLGTSGELRYPSYDEPGCGFPTRGCFQFYDARAGEDFRNYALNRFGSLSEVNKRWGTRLASKSEIRVPQDPAAFANNKDYQNTNYGLDLIDWYNSSLVAHGRRLLEASAGALTAAGIPASVPLGMKIPGVHWQMQNTTTPRLAEIAAGLVQSSLDLESEPVARKDAYGYKGILDMVAQAKEDAKREIILHFTAADKGNDDQQSCPINRNTSRAEALVFWVSRGAADRDITHKIENANPCVGHANDACDSHSWEHISNVFEFAGYSGLTLLRLTKKGCDPWDTDKDDYGSFIAKFKNRQMVTIHLSEWEPCSEVNGCFYNTHIFNGGRPADADFGLHYEAPQIQNGQVCRQWWKGQVASGPEGFQFTFNKTPDNTTVVWEGQPGKFDRTYSSGQGNEIFVLGRQNTTIFTSRPQCP
jgi:beta-amylase